MTNLKLYARLRDIDLLPTYPHHLSRAFIVKLTFTVIALGGARPTFQIPVFDLHSYVSPSRYSLYIFSTDRASILFPAHKCGTNPPENFFGMCSSSWMRTFFFLSSSSPS